MKKIISVVLTSAMLTASAVPAFAADKFKDVTKKNLDWAYDAIETMSDRGLIKGYEDGTFKPNKEVTRMEAFALFARLMGSNSEENKAFLESAKELYRDTLETYGLSYAEGDIAYLLARGVLDKSELDTYFKGGNKNQAMPRYEAAILITKAMLKEQEAKDEVLIDMSYSDVASIPNAAKQYVYYVTQKGIMTGMDGGKFSPTTAVLRSQIAVMLSKTCDAMGYTFDKGTVSSISTAVKNIKIKDADGSAFTIGYTDETRFYVNGEVTDASKIKAGNSIVLTYVQEGDDTVLAFADVIAEETVSKEVDETKAVIFKKYQTKGDVVLLTCVDVKSDDSESYPCAGDVKVTIDGKESNINKINAGDYITIGLSEDTIVEIEAMQKSTTLDATIEKVSNMGTITISSDDEEFDGVTLSFADKAKFYKNGDTSDFASLCRGDKAKITLEYGLISKITTTSAKKTVTGTLLSYTIAGTPTITINKDGEELTYDIPASAEVVINGETAKISDFAIGANLTLTVESDVVKKITAAAATSSLTSGSLSGEVTGIYESNITIVNDNGVSVNFTCAKGVKIVLIPTFDSYELKKIKVGDVLTAYGTYKNGIFVSTGITVTPASK